ncbi:MAG: threonine-phosphate decarboxylase [Candidatus Omnitrophica bacterium]|nr:threonine-phosphate decarboxylase [Candidatus Omnitrophota bacterium]
MSLRHGGELRNFSEHFGIPESEILDFSSNINPLGPPESVKALFEESAGELQVYPDSEALEFRREVARHFPLWPENVIAGNGSAELLDLAVRFLRPKRALVVEPSFLEYRRLLKREGAEIRSLFLKDREDFNFSLPELVNALRGNDLLILGHPNNPTGTHLAKEALPALLAEAKRRNVFVVLDEAFADWVPEVSLAREVRDDSYFFVVRSLTKFFTLPGIRIAYGLGSRKLIEKLTAHQTIWSVNRLAQKLGTAALRDEEFTAGSRRWLQEERNWLVSRLAALPGFKVFASTTNFLLVRHAPRPDREPLFEGMGRQKIYVRDLSELPGLGPTYFRVSVKRREDNLKLMEALEVVTAPLAGRTL